MFILANLVEALAAVLNLLLNAYMWILVARALISWVHPDPYNPIVQFLVAVTEPVLSPVRRLIPLHTIGVDISPIIVILAIIFLKSFLVVSLHQLADSLR